MAGISGASDGFGGSGWLETCLSATEERGLCPLPGPVGGSDGADHQQGHSRPWLPIVAFGYRKPRTANALPAEFGFKAGNIGLAWVCAATQGDVTAISVKGDPAPVASALHGVDS
jgi:hypothetical protein